MPQSVPGRCGAGLAPVQGLPAALSCCRGSSAHPGRGGSAWRQHGLPYLGGKLGAGSAAPRGIRVPFTLAALLWRGLPPSRSARGGAWLQGQPGGRGGQRGPLPEGAQPIPAAPSRCCGQGWGLADGAVVLRPAAPPFPSMAHVPGAVPARPLPCSHVSPRCSVPSGLLATPPGRARQPGETAWLRQPCGQRGIPAHHGPRVWRLPRCRHVLAPAAAQPKAWTPRINEFPKRGGPGEERVPAQEKVLAAARCGQSGPGRPESTAPRAAPAPRTQLRCPP